LEQIDLDSTALTWVRYFPEKHILRIELRTGRCYDYFTVPARIYRELLVAESKGRYYNHYIRNDFPCTEVYRRRAGHKN
jgi:KTSC domain